MRTHFQVGLALMLVFLFCSAVWAQPGVVMGTVADTSGVGIDNAYVTLSHGCGGGGGGGVLYSTYTAQDGSYILSDVVADDYRIKATKMGYGMAMENITVVAGGTLVVDLVLSGGCGGGGCPPETLEVVSVEGYAIVDTGGMCQDLYYLDTDNNGVADYRLNFGPPSYDPGSGAERPEDGDWCAIVGGLVEMMNPDMIIVYEINGLWWRDPMTATQIRRHRNHLNDQGGGNLGLTPAVNQPQITGFHPNPFNPETTVNFALPEAGQVNLSVYNLNGQKVADLVNGALASGQHQITWNASNLASGIYFFRLEAVRAVSVKKVMFTK